MVGRTVRVVWVVVRIVQMVVRRVMVMRMSVRVVGVRVLDGMVVVVLLLLLLLLLVVVVVVVRVRESVGRSGPKEPSSGIALRKL